MNYRIPIRRSIGGSIKRSIKTVVVRERERRLIRRVDRNRRILTRRRTYEFYVDLRRPALRTERAPIFDQCATLFAGMIHSSKLAQNNAESKRSDLR